MNKYHLITIKRHIEQVIMYPFVLIGRLMAILNPLEKEYDFFVFFPIYGIGGAEKINADIISLLSDKDIIIFFTRHSSNDKFLHFFQKPNITIKEIDKWTDNKLIYWASFIYRGICAHYINSQKKKPVVFNGQCNFAYKLFPHIHTNVRKVELIHNSNKKFAWVTFPYIPFIDKRVMITESIVKKHLEYYRELGVPGVYADRIVKITNSVYIPPYFSVKQPGTNLKVYYVGRGGFQKHLELLFEITRRCLSEKQPLEFHFAGTFEDEIPEDIRSGIVWHGMIGKEEDIYALHHQMDILLMTSRFEGFPMAIMEAMSCGVAIVSTAVDGIPEHINDGENGFLMYSTDDEQIVAEGIIALKKLIADRTLLSSISANNYTYAKANFSKEVFANAYRKVFALQ